MSPRQISSTGGGRAKQTIPGLRYLRKRPGRAFSQALGVTKSYAARARFELAVVFFPSVLPGTRGPGHAATASLIPSKPVAPVIENYRDWAPGSTISGPSTRPARARYQAVPTRFAPAALTQFLPALLAS